MKLPAAVMNVPPKEEFAAIGVWTILSLLVPQITITRRLPAGAPWPVLGHGVPMVTDEDETTASVTVQGSIAVNPVIVVDGDTMADDDPIVTINVLLVPAGDVIVVAE